MLLIQQNDQAKLKENINGTHTFAASCQEYFDLGNRVNGSFKIRPDAEHHAFDVECRFNDDAGITVLKPIQWMQEGYIFPPTEDQRCSGANCFTQDFEYSASTDQIKVRFEIRFYATRICSSRTDLYQYRKLYSGFGRYFN